VELSLYYGDDLVGTSRFDLTSYIDIGARSEKIIMVPPGGEPKNKNQLFMKGNSEEHPDAFIILRIIVDSIDKSP